MVLWLLQLECFKHDTFECRRLVLDLLSNNYCFSYIELKSLFSFNQVHLWMILFSFEPFFDVFLDLLFATGIRSSVLLD